MEPNIHGALLKQFPLDHLRHGNGFWSVNLNDTIETKNKVLKV
jgi:hypothetical protein